MNQPPHEPANETAGEAAGTRIPVPSEWGPARGW